MFAPLRSTIFATLLVAAAALFTGEAFYLALSEDQVQLWMIPVHLGVGAPLALLGAWIGAHSVATFREHFDLNWSNLQKTSWLLSMVLLLSAWIAATAKMSMVLTDQIATPWMAAAASALGAALLLFVAIVAAGAAVSIVESILQWCARHRRLRWIARPGTWLAAAPIFLALAIGGGFVVAADSMSVLPWAYVVGPASAVGAALIANRFFRSSPQRAPRWSYRLIIGVVIVGLFALFLPASFKDARQSFVDRPALASHWQAAINAPLDFDDDGSLFFFAGGDCAPFDPARGPNQPEIINDDIDQNCSGFDLSIEMDDFKGGPTQVERPQGLDDRPHVILISTDALSFSNTSPGGYEYDTTPNLAKWSDGATIFENAFSNSTSTRLALPGLLAGKMNSQMRFVDGRSNPHDYHEDEETMAVLLKNAGYRTVHLPGTAYFDTRWDGYRLGFDEVNTAAYRSAADEDHTSPEVTDAALEVIENHDDRRPLHLWVHYYDHHGPYSVPEGGKRFGDGESNEDRFNSELHFADGNWGRLLAAIEERWEPEEYVIVFTADHGEAFDDNHPREHHDFSVYTRPLHVPLIIQAPWGRGQRINGLTGHIDIVPTVANLVGIEPRDDWVGETLVPSLVDGTPPEKSVIYSLFYIPEAAKRGEHRFQMIGARTDEWYYFENRRRGDRRLVRWREDPLDRDNFMDREPEIFETYRYITQKRLEWLRDHEAGLTHVVDDLGSEF